MNESINEPINEPNKPISVFDIIRPEYRAIMEKALAEKHGRAGMGALMAAHMWAQIGSMWLEGALDMAAQEVVGRQLLDNEKKDLEKDCGEVVMRSTLTDSPENDLRAIMDSLRYTIELYNLDVRDRIKASNDVVTAAAKKMPLPFLKVLLEVPGRVVVLRGHRQEVNEFMHLGVGFILKNFVPVTVLADVNDGNWTNGLMEYKKDHDVPYLHFLTKWASAAQEQEWLTQLMTQRSLNGPLAVRSIETLLGVEAGGEIKPKILHNLVSVTKRFNAAVLAGCDSGRKIPKVKNIVVVDVEKRMEADPSDDHVLHPVYYVDGQKCVFTMEEGNGGGDGQAGSAHQESPSDSAGA